jgi:lipopolysaccharide export system permease protein
LKVLDRYITRTYLGTFLIVLLFLLGIFVVASVFNLLDSVLEAKEDLAEYGIGAVEVVLRYYLVNVPFVLLRLLPFVTFIAATIAFIRLARGNEIQPMVSSGRSPDRIALPVYVFAGLVTLAMLATQEWLVPRVAEDRIRLELIADGNVEGEVDDIPPMTDGAGNTWSIELYFPLTKTIEKVEVVRFKSPATGEYEGTVSAPRAAWRPEGEAGPGWYPEEGLCLPAEGSKDFGRIVELPPDRPLRTDLTPEAIERELARTEREAGRMLSISEAARLAREFSDLPRQKVALHTLITWPVANLLLVLLGLPFIFRLGERSLFVGVGVALLVCATYFAVDLICQDFGSRLVLPPTLASWLPVALFASAAVSIRSR